MEHRQIERSEVREDRRSVDMLLLFLKRDVLVFGVGVSALSRPLPHRRLSYAS